MRDLRIEKSLTEKLLAYRNIDLLKELINKKDLNHTISIIKSIPLIHNV